MTSWKDVNSADSALAYYQERIGDRDFPTLTVSTAQMHTLTSELGLLCRLEQDEPEVSRCFKIYDLRALADKKQYWMYFSLEMDDLHAFYRAAMTHAKTEEDRQFALQVAAVMRQLEKLKQAGVAQ